MGQNVNLAITGDGAPKTLTFTAAHSCEICAMRELCIVRQSTQLMVAPACSNTLCRACIEVPAHMLATSAGVAHTPEGEGGLDARLLTWQSSPHDLRGRERPRAADLLLPSVGARRGRRMGRRAAEEDVAERGEAGLLEFVQPVEVHRAHLDDERVGNPGEVVREEVRGDGDRDWFEGVVAGEGEHLDWAVGGVKHEEFVERLGVGEGRSWHAVLDQGGDRGICRLERRLEAQARHTIYDVEDDVEYARILGHSDEAWRICERAAESVGGGCQKPLVVDMENDTVCRDNMDVGEDSIDLKVGVEHKGHCVCRAVAVRRLRWRLRQDE